MPARSNTCRVFFGRPFSVASSHLLFLSTAWRCNRASTPGKNEHESAFFPSLFFRVRFATKLTTYSIATSRSYFHTLTVPTAECVAVQYCFFLVFFIALAKHDRTRTASFFPHFLWRPRALNSPHLLWIFQKKIFSKIQISRTEDCQFSFHWAQMKAEHYFAVEIIVFFLNFCQFVNFWANFRPFFWMKTTIFLPSSLRQGYKIALKINFLQKPRRPTFTYTVVVKQGLVWSSKG